MFLRQHSYSFKILNLKSAITFVYCTKHYDTYLGLKDD